MKYFSTFSGIGGFEKGIEQAYGNLRLQRSAERRQDDDADAHGRNYSSVESVGVRDFNAACVGYCEIDRFASAAYRYHYPTHRAFGDITAVAAESIPDFDFFAGGFPCQTFSIAGKRAGFNDTRGTLFFEIARILAHQRPAHFLLENVKGLLSHDGGKTYAAILGILADLGYFVETIVLNSKNYGVPQNRERIFFIGHFAERCVGEILSFGDGGGGMGAKTGLYALNDERQGNRIYDGDGCAATVTCNKTGGNKLDKYKVGQRIRRLTPVECELLQGFPRDWTKYGTDEKGNKIEMSDSARYKMCGNAVTTNVIEAIVSEMIDKKCLEL